MGFQALELKMPTDFNPDELENTIAKKLKLKHTPFTFTIDRQSLDARHKKKNTIHWNIKVGVSSPALPGPDRPIEKKLEIPFKKRDKKVLVIGNGPAGFFTAYTLILAGFDVTILEQGPEVEQRFKDIVSFERNATLEERSNYAFGEGGAGTFSDGKLTSRTKTISLERHFIFDTYISAGAPHEISWLSSPHLGSDNLRKIVKNLRHLFREKDGKIHFNTMVQQVRISQQKIHTAITDKGEYPADIFIFAPGHSSYETYRMLIRNGIPFRVKPFAIGTRVEHPQDIINLSQWGSASLPGLKAAEYRLTFKPNQPNLLPVYSFCMCPGGKVVPATPFKNTNIVNGMSNYRRNSSFSNSAIVAALDLNHLLSHAIQPLEALDWLQQLEERFFTYSHSYAAPACPITDLLSLTPGSPGISLSALSSYPLGLIHANFHDLFPATILSSLQEGLRYFSSLIKGFDQGIALGLESKTSSPIQAIRNANGSSPTVKNLYICGEGSGFAGGIISSAADGMKTALEINI